MYKKHIYPNSILLLLLLFPLKNSSRKKCNEEEIIRNDVETKRSIVHLKGFSNIN